jgi:hypothetical protein
MHEYIYQHFSHFVALVVLVSRAGDLLTTFLASPTLKLEANVFIRRFGWKGAFATLLVALVPYYNIWDGLMIATASLLVSAANGSRIMMARALGEEEYLRVSRSAISLTGVSQGLLYLLMPSAFMILLAGLMYLVIPESPAGWSSAITSGVFAYALAIAIWNTVRFFKIKNSKTDGEPNQALPRNASAASFSASTSQLRRG